MPRVIDKFDALEWFSEPNRSLDDLVEDFMGVEYKGKEGKRPCLGFGMVLSSANRIEIFEAGYHYYGHAVNVEDRYREHGWFEASKTQVNIHNTLNDVCRARVMIELVFDNDNYPHVQMDTVVSKIWPAFVTSQEAFTNAITVEDLICQISGLPNVSAGTLGLMSFDRAKPKDVLRSLKYLEIKDKHRGGYFRSELNAYLAEHLINHLTGGQFKLLRAKTCGWPVKVEEEEGVVRAKAYKYKTARDKKIQWKELANSPKYHTFATVKQLHELAENLFRPERGFTSQEKLDEMLRSRMELESDQENRFVHIGAGIGCVEDADDAPGVKIFGRQTDAEGFGSCLFFIPKLGLVGAAAGTHVNAETIAMQVADYIAKHTIEGFPE